MHTSIRSRFGIACALLVAATGLVATSPAPASHLPDHIADFNGDSYSDLAVGVPLEDVNGIVNAGAVNVIYGSAGGLTVNGPQFWNEASPGMGGDLGLEENFGWALAAGDFNGDGYDDLAIGIPNEDTGSGAVRVLFGSVSGLKTNGTEVIDATVALDDLVEHGDRFGAALAVGDFGRGSEDDLAIGAPGETLGPAAGAGSVAVVYGSPSGFQAAGKTLTKDNDVWHLNNVVKTPSARAGDRFGSALAAGHFGASAGDELAIGVPGADFLAAGGLVSVIGAADSGEVVVIPSAEEGLKTPAQTWSQNAPDVEGTAEPADQFGSSLVVGNFGRGSLEDLAIGVPGEAIGSGTSEGAVNVLYGAAERGLAAGTTDQIWHQDVYGVRGTPESLDRFGSSLAAGDFGNSAEDDLAIGVPYEYVFPTPSRPVLTPYHGAVNVLFGTADGLTASGDYLLDQEGSCFYDSPEVTDYFGFDVFAADFGQDRHADLAIGVPGEAGYSSTRRNGWVQVMYGSPFGLTCPAENWQQYKIESSGDSGEFLDQFGWSFPEG